MSKKKVIYLNREDSLQDILKKLKAEGVKKADFSEVRFTGDYAITDDYGPDAYSDLRFEWKTKK